MKQKVRLYVYSVSETLKALPSEPSTRLPPPLLTSASTISTMTAAAGAAADDAAALKKDKKKKKKTNDSCNNSNSSSSSRRRLYSEAAHEWPVIGVGVAAMLVSAASNQALPRFMGRLIDAVSSVQSSSSSSSSHTCNDGRSSSSSSSFYSLATVVVTGGIASCLRTVALQTASERIAARLRQAAFSCLLQEKQLQWFHQTPSTSSSTTITTTTANGTDEKEDAVVAVATPEEGMSPAAVSSVLTQDVTNMAQTLTTVLANILRSASSVIFSTYNMLALNPALFGVAVTVVPVVGVVAMVLRKSVKKVAVQQQHAAAVAASFVEERLTHISMVRHCNRAGAEVQKYAALSDQSLRLASASAVHAGLFMGFVFSATSTALLLVVWRGGRAVRDGTMTGGQLSTFSTYAFLLGLGTSGIVQGLSQAVTGFVSAERYYKLMLVQPPTTGNTASVDDEYDDAATATSNTKTKITTTNSNEDDTIMIAMDSVESIAVRNLCFSYTSDKPVLNNLSFQVPRGKVVALVGKNGEGKSTLASLLAGLYMPESGSIDVICNDGTRQDFTKLSKTTKKCLVQVIPQTTSLFNMSILENVRYSNPAASVADVQRALHEANCDDFVSRLGGGGTASAGNSGIIETFCIGLNGCKLSGGERQRLALARALLSDPAVLVMDEATTSMDAQGSTAVSEAVRSARSRRAMLLVTHQPKTLELADVVLVLKEGRIVEEGAFATLRSDPNSELCKLMPTVYSCKQL